MLPAFLENLDPDIFLRDNYLVLDFEVDSSHGDYGNPIHLDNSLLLASIRFGPTHPFRIAWGDVGTVSLWGDEFSQQELLDYIKDADFIVAHQAKYELGWLRRCGLDLRTVLAFDTQIAEYTLLGNLAAGSKDTGLPRRSISLDMCSRRRGLPIKDPVVDTLIKNQVNPVRIPRPWLQRRCEQDVETTEQVFLDQRGKLKRMNLLPVQYTRCLLTPVLADIEPEGMMLDAEEVEKEYTEHTARLASLEAQMKEITGGINWRSNEQMAEFLYDKMGFEELIGRGGKPKRTPTGKRLTNLKAIDKLEAKTDEQKRFLGLRKEIGRVGAAISKNLDFFLGVVRERGSVFFAEFNQTSTATGRLSSSGITLTFSTIRDQKGKPKSARVQFQNMPRPFKRLFKAKRDGWYMVDPDGSQIEFRVAAELGNDEQAIRDIEDPSFDSHKFTASVLNDIAVDQVTTDGPNSQRQLAKPDTFKPLYGGSKGTEKQEQYYAAFRARYSGIAATQEAWVDEVLLTGTLITPWGLRYYWPNARKYSSGYVNVGSAVYNYPIQALATAEIMPIAIVYLWHRIREAELEEFVFLVNTVHDSVPCEVHPSVIDKFTELVKQCFTKDVYRYLQEVYGMDFKVPLGVGIKVGERWGKGTEQAFDIWKDGRERKIK